MLIGVDLDSVLAEINPPMNHFVNQKNNTNFSTSDYIDYDLTKIWHCSDEEVYKRIYDFYESPDMAKIKPMPGAIDALAYIKQRHQLIVITSRPDSTKTATLDWINTYFPDTFEKIIFSNQFTPDGHTRKTKGELGVELGIMAMIDDHIGYIEDCIKCGIKGYLFEASWNKGREVTSEITRISGWHDVEKYF